MDERKIFIELLGCINYHKFYLLFTCEFWRVVCRPVLIVADDGDCWIDGDLDAEASSSKNNDRDCLPIPVNIQKKSITIWKNHIKHQTIYTRM